MTCSYVKKIAFKHKMKLMENFKKRRNSQFSIAVDPESKYASYVIIKLQ